MMVGNELVPRWPTTSAGCRLASLAASTQSDRLPLESGCPPTGGHCLETFLAVQQGGAGCATGMEKAEATVPFRHPIMHRTAFHNKGYPPTVPTETICSEGCKVYVFLETQWERMPGLSSDVCFRNKRQELRSVCLSLLYKTKNLFYRRGDQSPGSF